ncbi:hypothetical protein ACLX1H_005512 [Fusarium chlamydosporum]
MSDYPLLEVESQVTQQNDTTFTINLPESFAFGTVPNGGFISAVFLRVASQYLASSNQPDTFAANWHFLNATYVGPAVLVVEEARKGRALSIIHITLYQEGILSQSPWISEKSKKKIVAYIANNRIEAEGGLTLSTSYQLRETPPPVDLVKLADDRDMNWERLRMIFMDMAPLMQHVEFYSPKNKTASPACWDVWFRMSNGERWKTWMLSYLADMTPALVIEGFRPTDFDAPTPKDRFAFDKIYWLPTVSLSLDVKKALPKDGEEWLRVRIEAKVIKNGS